MSSQRIFLVIFNQFKTYVKYNNAFSINQKAFSNQSKIE